MEDEWDRMECFFVLNISNTSQPAKDDMNILWTTKD
jgi:hypothetical protein